MSNNAGSGGYALSTVDIVFDSSRRDSQTLDNPKFFIRNIDNVVGISIAWVSIPFTFYMIDNTNNTFQLRSGLASTISSATWGTYYLKPGTYSAQTFPYEWSRVLGGSPASENNLDWVTYVDSVSSRFTLYNTGLDTSTETAQIRFNGNSSLAKMLGFDADTVYQTQVVSTHWVDGKKVNSGNPVHLLIAPQQVNFVPPTIDLHSVRLSGAVTCQRDPGNEDTKILTIPVLGNFTSQIQFQPSMGMVPTPSRLTFTDVDFALRLPDRTVYSIGAVDPNPNPAPATSSNMSLNNVPFQVCVRFYRDLGYGAY